MMNRKQWKAGAALVALALSGVVFAAARLPFRDGFESGNFSAWGGGLDSTMTVNCTAQAAEGRCSVQSVLINGTPTDNYKDYYFGDHRTVGGAPVTPQTGLWLSFQNKFDPGFNFGQIRGNHKLAIINFENENGRRIYQIIINVDIVQGVYIVEHLKWNADGSFNTSFASCCRQNIGTPVAPRIGQWDKLKLFLKPNTPGQTNGAIQLWINGVLKANHQNIQLREATSYNPNKLILSSHSSDATRVGIQRWDDFYLGETDPDTGVRPNPPVIDNVR